MSAIDSTKSAINNLLALVNAANTGQTLLSSQVTAGSATAQAADGQGRNTQVTLTAVAGQGYTGSQTYTYTRRGLNDSVVSPVDSYTATIGVTAAALVTALCTQLGLVASEIHLEDPANPGVALSGALNAQQASLNLVSAAGSLLYVDASSQAIAMTWNEPTVALATATPNTALSGFDAA
jgi:hypothetical protein